MKSARIAFTLLLVFLCSMHGLSQVPQTDTTIIFQPANPEIVQKSLYTPLLNAWGFDLLISNNGFGAGVFFRREFSDDFAGFISFAISDVKDDAEFDRIVDIYGSTFVPYKKNRLLLFPLVAGVQYRIFRDDIVDNFRPYLTAGLGPSMVFVSPYSRKEVFPGPFGTVTTYEQVEFFSSLKYGQARYTLGGFIGLGAYFGMEKGSLSGINIRYYVVPFSQGIEVMEGGYIKTFGGFYITLNFGSLY